MKHAARLLLIVLLAWGVWLVFGGGPDDPGFVDGGVDLLDADAPSGGDLRDATARPEDGMVGVGEVGRGPDGTGDGDERGDVAVVELAGRVVDTRRRPVAGAQVELRAGGRVAARALSGPDGTFTLTATTVPSGRAQRGTLIARHERYGAGTTDVWLAEGGSLRASPIVLEEAHGLRVRVEADGRPSAFGRIAVVRRVGGRVTPLGTSAIGEDGTATMEGLAAGPYEVFATLPGRGRGMTRVRLPQGEGEVAVVTLGGERLLDVIVEDAVSGEPVAGASVEVGEKRTLPRPTGPGYLPGLPSALTDGNGRATIRGLGLDETLYVNVSATGYVEAVWWRASSQVARPGESEVRVRLRRPRRMTFPIYEGTTRAPADGTVLAVEFAGRGLPETQTASARVDGSYVVMDGLPATSVTGVLRAPDGAQARFTASPGVDMGNAVEFTVPRTVRVRVHEPGGEPVAGLALRLNPLDGAGRIAPQVTGEDGVAVFENVGGEKVGVHIRAADAPWGGPLLGRIDLTDEAEEYAFELTARSAFVLRIRLDGEVGLPTRYTLVAGGVRVAAEDIVEDPSAGELQVTLRPADEQGDLAVQLMAAGYLPASLSVASGPDGGVHEVDLISGGRIRARVTPPEDGSYSLALQRFDASESEWTPAASGAAGPGAPPPDGGDGVHLYAGLATGRYRIVEPRSGYEGRPIDVAAGGGVVDIHVDLSGTVEVRGRVKAPPGTDLTQVRVRIVGRHAPEASWSGVRVEADGTFTLRALRGEPLELSVAHPLLSPAPGSGTVRAVAGGPPPTLVLVAGPEVSFRVVGFEGMSSKGGALSAPVRAQLFRDDLDAQPVLAVQPNVDAGLFSFGGFEPGRYTLWLGLGPNYAPVIRPRVELGSGRTDLGTITPSPGATLVIELGVGRGSAVWASATSTSGPRYTRHASGAADGSEVRITGLGKGTFDVVVRSAGGRGTRLLHEGQVTVDGSGETRLRVGGR